MKQNCEELWITSCFYVIKQDEVGHSVFDEDWNVLLREGECDYGIVKTLMVAVREVLIGLKSGELWTTERGKPEGNCLSLLVQQVPFFNQRFYHCLPLWIAFFTTSCFWMSKICSYRWVLLQKILESDQHLWGQFLSLGTRRNGITNFHSALSTKYDMKKKF